MSTELRMPTTRVMRVADIKPYENNPRRLPDEAIDKLRTSITEYGYQQPIVVDTNDVIVVGHTRHRVLQEMGVESVEVYVTDLPPEKVKQYRVIDNRLGELSQWDHSALVMELREFEQGLLEQFFPDVDLEIESISKATADVTDAAVAQAIEKVTTVKDQEDVLTTAVVCPSCFTSFNVATASLPGISRLDYEVLSSGRAE